MYHRSPSGGGNSSLTPSSYPLSYHTPSDPEPRPFRLDVFNDPPYSQPETPTASRVVEVLDSLDPKAKDDSGAEGYEAFSKSSIHIVGPSLGREMRNVTVPKDLRD